MQARGTHTLRSILEAYGIDRPHDLVKLLGVSTQVASYYWLGKYRMPNRHVLTLHRTRGIPLEAMLMAEGRPKGRPTLHGRIPVRKPENMSQGKGGDNYVGELAG